MIQNALKFLRGALVFIPSVMLLAVLGHSEAAFAATENVHKLQVKAERGFVKEEVELASAYFTGDGVAQDARLAAYWYQKAAESGNPEAQNQVGYFYEAGLGELFALQDWMGMRLWSYHVGILVLLEAWGMQYLLDGTFLCPCGSRTQHRDQH